MRIRTVAAAALAAAGLSVVLTGAASAATTEGPPPGDVFIVTCKDGRIVTRPVTDEDRERIEEMRSGAGWERSEGSGDGPVRFVRVAPAKAGPGHAEVIPAERGARPKDACATAVLPPTP